MPNALVLLGLTTFQPRCFSKLKSRADCDSDSMTVDSVTTSSPYGLSGPTGSARESLSTTLLDWPSTSRSSRATRKCWWNGA